MRKLFQLLTILWAATFFVSAYAAETPTAQSQEFMQSLEAKIKLTPEQQTAMEKIITDSMTQREQVISSYQGQKGMMAKKDLRDDLQPINEKMQTEVKKVLDEQQYQVFLDVQKAHQEQLRERINNEF
jgi:hypothetical protein